MKQYEVSFTIEGSGIYQANIVITDKSSVEVGLWFQGNNPRALVMGICIATSDHVKPGKPIIRI